MWSQAALAAEAADDFFITAMISAPRLATLGINVSLRYLSSLVAYLMDLF
jgi:hypothetical protein